MRPVLFEVNFYGFSLGGLVARQVASLEGFAPYRKYLNKLVCINTPHLGTSYSCKLVRSAACMCAGLRRRQSLAEMGDTSKHGTLLRLAKATPGFAAFHKVVLVGVLGDGYSGVPSSLACVPPKGKGASSKRLQTALVEDLACTTVQRILITYSPLPPVSASTSAARARFLHTLILADRETLHRLVYVAGL